MLHASISSNNDAALLLQNGATAHQNGDATEGVSSQAHELSTLILQAAAMLGLREHTRDAGQLLKAIEGKVAGLLQQGPEEPMAAGPFVARAEMSESQVTRPCFHCRDRPAHA